ncbi:MAG: hypothetical protein JXJ04_22390 [Spirochaetales bacterium]|nr:hypothetical protein [Spirochaetales bacterium]
MKIIIHEFFWGWDFEFQGLLLFGLVNLNDYFKIGVKIVVLSGKYVMGC